MAWGGLGMGAENYLIVKENYVAEQTAPYVSIRLQSHTSCI